MAGTLNSASNHAYCEKRETTPSTCNPYSGYFTIALTRDCHRHSSERLWYPRRSSATRFCAVHAVGVVLNATILTLTISLLNLNESSSTRLHSLDTS